MECQRGFLICIIIMSREKTSRMSEMDFRLAVRAGVQGHAVPTRIAEDGPPANVGNLGLGKDSFPTVRFDLGKAGIDIVCSDIYQQAVGFILDGSLSRQLDESSAGATFGRELHVVVDLVSFDLP